MSIQGFTFQVGDVVVPLVDDGHGPVYLESLVIDSIHPEAFMYTVIDHTGDQWQANALMIENDFMLVKDVCIANA